MIRGSCLCATVKFELASTTGPFELCHCNRCRKVSGSAFMAGIGVHREDFRWISGQDSISVYEAPILDAPPAYRVCFCSRCGSPVPDPQDRSDWLELPAGLLDGDPTLRPDKHIFVEHKATWHTISDKLPQLDRPTLIRHRAKPRPQ